MDVGTLALKLVRSVLSVPVIFGLVALVALSFFRQDIKALIGRISAIKLPSGSELCTSQQSRNIEAASQHGTPGVPADEPIPLPNDIQLTQDQQTAVCELIRNERTNVELWEYRYLDYFLVPATQYVLDWMAIKQQPIAVSVFDDFWKRLIQSAEEQNAIIHALQSHRLIVLSDGLITLTPKGQEYIEWRGPFRQTII